jgi:ABC-2 type transport system permease protein
VKFREIFRFEFVYQARRVRTWLYFAVLFAVAYLLVRTDPGAGDGVVNSPYDIAQDTVLTGLLWAVMAPAVAGSAAARDVQTRMHPLIYAAPISKADYLGGRFLAAFVLNALILLAVPLGILSALYLPGREPELVGPLRPAVYLTSYGVLALPTAFTFTAVQFSLAALKRRAIVSYLGTVLFFVTVGVTAGLFLNVLQMPTLGQLLDPTCRLTVLILMSDTLTPLEKNTVLIGLESAILANRLLWIGIALAILAFTHVRFRLGHRAA